MNSSAVSLKISHPELAKQWSDKNTISIDNVSKSSKINVTWICELGHEWVSPIYKRTQKKRGCHYCTGYKSFTSRRLIDCYPDIAQQWSPKNSKPVIELSNSSSLKGLWICDKGHEWEAWIHSRVRHNSKCPVCFKTRLHPLNNFATECPKLIPQWSPKNYLKPHEVTASSDKIIIWICELGHEWETTVHGRMRGKRGCPRCALLNRGNSIQLNKDSGGSKYPNLKFLSDLYPDTIDSWSPKNTIKLENITIGKPGRYLWQCASNHEWRMAINEYIKIKKKHNTACPECRDVMGLRVRRIVDKYNHLGKTDSQLTKEWSSKNSFPYTAVSRGSEKSVWWKCSKGHEWKAVIRHRVREKSKCPYCTHKRATPEYNLTLTHPILVKEWHPKNNLKACNFLPNSRIKVLWNCSNGHEWIASIHNRVNGTQCARCVKAGISRIEMELAEALAKRLDDSFKTGNICISAGGKKYKCDMFLESRNLIIEYDGSYWHKNKFKQDMIKTNALEKEGYQVIRIRESPLKPISRKDIIIGVANSISVTVNDVILKSLQLIPDLVIKCI